MNRTEAYRLLSEELLAYRQLGHDQLVALVGDNASRVRRTADGLDYAIDIWVRWRNAVNGGVVVNGAVGPADWGSPHDRLDDSCVVSKDTPSVA